MCVGFGFWRMEIVKNKTSLGLIDRKNLDNRISVAPRVRKRSRGLVCFSVGTNTREMMILSRIFGVVVWQLMCGNLGILR
jgi:hypothetical protein